MKRKSHLKEVKVVSMEWHMVALGPTQVWCQRSCEKQRTKLPQEWGMRRVYGDIETVVRRAF